MYSLDNIGFLEITDRRARTLDGIHYLEFAVTSRCNFSCPYCNRLHEKDLSTQQIRVLFDYLATEHLQFVQFTGGEPLCREDLVELVRHARLLGVRCGVSTNGSFSLDHYLKLVDAGVELFSISFDSHAQEKADVVASNIRALSKHVYVNVGTVIDARNREDVESIIDYVLSLGASDVKLSTDTHSEILLPRINRLYDKPILDYRIRRFNKGEDMRGGTQGITRCSLIGNDVSVLGEKHFPCLVYAREGGSAVGNLFDKEEVKSIKQERVEFMQNHSPEKDPLCRRFCMDFKCAFNRKCLGLSPSGMAHGLGP